MRRLNAVFMLLMLAFTLTACTTSAAPNPTGWWETSQKETLCATKLLLNPDSTFYQYSEGVLWKGTWTLEGSTLTLAVTDTLTLQPDAPDTEPRFIVYALDKAMAAIDIGGGLHLYRGDNEDVTGYWWCGSSSLHLMDSGIFIFHKHEFQEYESLELVTLDGGEYLTGHWTQEGLIITLHSEGGSVQTVTAVIDPESVGAGWMTLHYDGVEYNQMVE